VAGLYERVSEETLDPYLRELILDSSHPGRVQTLPGPTLFYRQEGNDKQQFALDLKMLLFSPTTEVRKAVIDYFVRRSGHGERVITDQARRTLLDLQTPCLSSDNKKWQAASIRIYDVLESDLQCQLAGLRQSIKERFEDGLRTYLPSLLKPSVAAMEALALPFPRPSANLESIVAEIRTQAEMWKASSRRSEPRPKCRIWRWLAMHIWHKLVRCR
jgi:hypothetical protein